LSRPAFDPGKARAELDAAGLRPGPDGVRARLRYRTSLDATALGVARAIAAMAREVGLEVDIVPSEWGRFVADLAAGEFDLYTLTGVGIDDPDWFSFVLHSKSIPPAGANRPRYRNTAFDALLDEGRRASAEAARAAAYVGAQAMIAEDLPMLPLWFETSTVVSSPRVEGWTPRPDGDFAPLVELRWAGP
jgi:peptide/nickel transport system substrate-binding protein